MIRVLIADDQGMVRTGFTVFLDAQADIEVVGDAADGAEAVERSALLRPDVVLMDVNMPGGGGLAATRIIRDQLPGVDVVVLTIHDDDEYVIEFVNAGAKGYMLKDVDPGYLIDGIRRVRAGESFIPATLMARVLQTLRRRTPIDSAPAPASTPRGRTSRSLLTEREREILQLIVDGQTNREIAQTLFISEKTVKNHVTNLLRKLDLSDRTQAAVYAIRHGLVPIVDE